MGLVRLCGKARGQRGSRSQVGRKFGSLPMEGDCRASARLSLIPQYPASARHGSSLCQGLSWRLPWPQSGPHNVSSTRFASELQQRLLIGEHPGGLSPWGPGLARSLEPRRCSVPVPTIIASLTVSTSSKKVANAGHFRAKPHFGLGCPSQADHYLGDLYLGDLYLDPDLGLVIVILIEKGPSSSLWSSLCLVQNNGVLPPRQQARE